MWDIIFKDRVGERPLEMQKALTFHEVMHPDIGNMAKKISQKFSESQRGAGKTVYRTHGLLSRFLGTFPESVPFSSWHTYMSENMRISAPSTWQDRAHSTNSSGSSKSSAGKFARVWQPGYVFPIQLLPESHKCGWVWCLRVLLEFCPQLWAIISIMWLQCMTSPSPKTTGLTFLFKTWYESKCW